MGLGRSAAVVIGSFPLGESDRVVTFFSRDFGRLRGVARAARRIKSRFGGSLELFTLGQLVFFDTGRSELVRIDHFDVTHPFAALREDLGRPQKQKQANARSKPQSACRAAVALGRSQAGTHRDSRNAVPGIPAGVTPVDAHSRGDDTPSTSARVPPVRRR